MNFVKNVFQSIAPKDNRKDTPFANSGEEERNALLKKISFAIERCKCEDMETYIHEYVSTYGSLTGTEKVWFYTRFGDIYDNCMRWINDELLFFATEWTEKFFFAIINGEEEAAKEYRRKAELQAALKKAFESNDIIAFDELLKQGADINYLYYCASYYGNHKVTLWQRGPQGRMLEYFMTREDVPQVKKIKDEERLLRSLKDLAS